MVNRLIAEASSDMRAGQGVPDDMKTAASDVLVALARSHFHFVMAELQSHLKVTGKVPDETVLLTLGKMACKYALQCIPFVGMTLLSLRAMLSQVGSGQTLRVICSVLEQWSQAVIMYICEQKQRPFPRTGEGQLSDHIYLVFCYTMVNWLGCREEELLDVTEEPDPTPKAELSSCMEPQAIICPEEPVAHLHSWESGGSEASCVVALGLLAGLSHSDAPAARKKLPQVVEAVQSICDDSSARVRQAVLEFIRELLSSGSQICWAWDVVGHIFNEFSRTSGRMVAGNLFAWETPEDGVLRALCMEILCSLDVSLRGVTKLLWPRLLQYVVPAQYSGMLIPLSKCLRALAERWERVGCEEEESDAVDSLEQAQLPAPQALLVRLLVVAAAVSHKRSDQAVAALQLLQVLSGRIHRALGAVWVTKIPLLLQYLEGENERSLDSEEWEHRLLKFLRASLESIEDEVWTMDLSQELSQKLGSSVPGSWEKLFLYKAFGTVLAACQDLRHVEGQVLRFLQQATSEKQSEAQGMISVVSRASEGHFNLVLDTVTTFSAAFTRDWLYPPAMDLMVKGFTMETVQATCAVLMCFYSGIALHAPKDLLLPRLDMEIMGRILWLSRAKRRDTQLKLALVQSITQVSSAIQAVGDCGSFELSSRKEATQILLDWIQDEPWDALVYGVFQALEELSKLRPLLTRKDTQKLLTVCCQVVFSYPSAEQMRKGRKTVRAAVNMKLLHRRSIEDLGHLIQTLLKGSPSCFDDMVYVLKGWLTSANALERERGLHLCACVLEACKEQLKLMRRDSCKQFISLVALLGTLTGDCLDTSCLKAWVCLGCLLHMQANTMTEESEDDETECLYEKLNSPDTKTLAETHATITKALCKCIPPDQATSFMTAALDTRLHIIPMCVKTAWKWVFTFLVECREEIGQEVPKILSILYTYVEQHTHRPFSLQALVLLAQFHEKPLIMSLLQKGPHMDSVTVELWKTLGESIAGTRVLRFLAKKLDKAGDDHLQSHSSAHEQYNHHSLLETVTITNAICKMVVGMSSTDLRQLLPQLFPSLLKWASGTLAEEEWFLHASGCREITLEKPCRFFLSSLQLVLGKCMASKWMKELLYQTVWERLEDPLDHLEGVCLLSRILLKAGLVYPCLLENLSSWLESCSHNLWKTATAFLEEASQGQQ
ncbi:maestro heat-like repeat-containing protein family member 2B [Porphyrio hochstetteri]